MPQSSHSSGLAAGLRPAQQKIFVGNHAVKLFIFEYLCSGAAGLMNRCDPLMNEGRAMLSTLLTDLSQQTDLKCLSVWSPQLGDPPELQDVEFHQSKNATHAMELIAELATAADQSFLIAPESEGILINCCHQLPSPACHAGMRSLETIGLCGDKLKLAQHLERNDIPTPPTIAWDRNSPPPLAFPFIMKPRHGAGCLQSFRTDCLKQWEQQLAMGFFDDPAMDFIAQPFVAGTPHSVFVVVPNDASKPEIWPMIDQNVTVELLNGRFQYAGGRLNPRPVCDAVRSLVHQLIDRLPDARGCWGLDFINDADDQLVVIEINPRLTTSYLGYRQATSENLAVRIIEGITQPSIVWRSDSVVEFSPHEESART